MAITTIPSSGTTDGTNMVLIKTQTISSSVSSVDFVNGSSDVVFDSTYKTYQCVFEDVFLSATGNKLRLRVSDDTGSTFESSGYLSHVYRNFNGSSTGSALETATTSVNLNQVNVGTSLATGTMNGTVTFHNPSAAKDPQVSTLALGSDGTFSVAAQGGGTYNTVGAIDAFQFFPTAGTINGGIFSLYGVRT